MEKISFVGEDGDTLEFFVMEKTTLGGVDYMLVTDSEDEEADAYVLKDLSCTSDETGSYEFVEDDETLKALGQIFQSLLDDIDIV